MLLAGNANVPLAQEMGRYLGTDLSGAFVGAFSDGETRVELQCNVRGAEVYIVQSTCAPTNHHLMEALVMVDACRRASAQQITLVTPYFGYARQERKSAPRTPITAKLTAELIEASGVDRVLALELHNSAIQGFFKIPVDHLFAKPVFHTFHLDLNLSNGVVVSPDAGGVERARAMAKKFSCELAIIDKRRDRPNESAVMNIVGDVKGKDCLIIDDIVDTGGSLVKAAAALRSEGAESVSAAITHAVLSGESVSRIQASCLERLAVTDSIPLSDEAKRCPKIVQVSVAKLLAEAVRRIHSRDSISSLFL